MTQRSFLLETGPMILATADEILDHEWASCFLTRNTNLYTIRKDTDIIGTHDLAIVLRNAPPF